jgi:predicted TIM-barrel fold metal-dependent hydrolase
MRRSVSTAAFLCLFFLVNASAQEPVTPWRSDPLFQRLSAALDRVPAIDMHTHLIQPGEFNPSLGDVGPLMIRSSHPWLPSAIRKRFGVTAKPDDWPATVVAIKSARATMARRLGEHGYWMDHLNYTVTDIALVNQYEQKGTDSKRLRWVPHATVLLYPLPAEHLMARSPSHKTDIAEAQKHLHVLFKEANLSELPLDLPTYVRFLDDTLRRWQKQGAVGIKFWDAYLRTLRIADVPASEATTLYAKGFRVALSRNEYLALQDYLWRHILLEAGKIKLPVHIHSSFGVPPFLRTLESDVRNLEDVLADPSFFETPIVLIHGGAPWYEVASYLALKPNVWIDISALGFLRPVPELANILRQYFLFAPDKVLFGTDAGNAPSVPGGADVQHILVSRAVRDALYVALSGLIRDGVITEQKAIQIGRGVLRENALRLHGWK